MRISDSMKFKLFQTSVSKVGQQLDDVQLKISTQKNINTPSDDPIKYSTSIQYDVQRSINGQYSNNLQRLSTLVSMYDSSFSNMADELTNVSQIANNFDTMGTDLRQSAVEQIEGIIEQFVTVGNTKVGSAYIFGGQQGDTPPFRLNDDYSVTYMVGLQGEDATKIFVDSGQTSKLGVSGREAFYDTRKVVFGNVDNSYGGDVYSNTDSFAYVVDGTNNTINVNGNAVTLTSGVYSGSALAKEVQNQLGNLYVINDSNNTLYRDGVAVTLTNGTYTGAGLAAQVATQLGAGYAAAYNAAGRTFNITNNSGAAVTFNWSDAGASAADILGFNRQDSVVANAASDTSDHSVANFMSVAFDSTTRKFSIANNTGGDVTLNWSNAGTTAESLLGFDAVNSVIESGKSDVSDVDSGRKAFLVDVTTGGATTGATRAAYRYSIDGGATWTTGLTVNTGGADTTADITIADSGANRNDTLYLNATAVYLTAGNYTGASLATDIQTQLNAVQAGHTVSYDATTRKFSIANNTGAVETFNWSNAGANAAGVLGFDNVDSVVSNGGTDKGDYDAGMFIDGAGVANTTNNRVKLLFGTDANYNLSTGDTFQVKDLSVFEMLTNLRHAFLDDNSTWVSKNMGLIDDARSLVVKNNSVIAFQGTQAATMTTNNKAKDGQIQTLQADLVNADMSELATEFSTLLNTYQALLSTLARMQSVSILNYLK